MSPPFADGSGRGRSVMVRALAVVFACTALACGSANAPPAETSAPISAEASKSAEACMKPLKEFCTRTRPCPSFSDSLSEVRRFGSSESCFIARSGTCGDLQFTQMGFGLGSETRFFDHSGTMVAGMATTDLVIPPCDGVFYYGQRLSCSLVATRNYCEGPFGGP